MWRSTTALLDTATARTLLDTPAARSVLNRFSSSAEDDADAGEVHHAPSAIVGVDPVRVPKLGSFEVMIRTIDIAQSALMRHTLAAYPPDLLIEVPRTACRSLEFHRAAEVIEIGQELAAVALDTLAPQASGSQETSDA